MPAQIDIANMALIVLGEPTITALTDNTESALIISKLWNMARDAELRAHAWRFAIVRASLPADVATPAWGFASQYTLPGDCMRVLQIGEVYPGADLSDYRTGDAAIYRVEGDKILSRDSGILHVRYVSNAKDVGLWDVTFAEAFAYRLARLMAPRLTESVRTKKPDLDGEYALAMRRARMANALERPPEIQADDTWLLSRIVE